MSEQKVVKIDYVDLPKITNLPRGTRVVFSGWIHKIHIVGKIVFVIVRGRDALVQVVFTNPSKELIKGLNEEDVIKVVGIIKDNPTKPGKIEVHAESIEILNKRKRFSDLPIEFKNSTIHSQTKFSKRLNYRFLDLRNPKVFAIFKFESLLSYYITEYFMKNNFIRVYTPKILSSATESGAEVFPLV